MSDPERWVALNHPDIEMDDDSRVILMEKKELKVKLHIEMIKHFEVILKKVDVVDYLNYQW